PGPLDLTQSTTSQSIRNEILCLRGSTATQAQHCLPPTEATRPQPTPTRAAARSFPFASSRFAFLGLAVITVVYARVRDDETFLVEHLSRTGRSIKWSMADGSRKIVVAPGPAHRSVRATCKEVVTSGLRQFRRPA